MTDRNRVLVAGIGSDFGDDRLGWIVVDRLSEAKIRCRLQSLRKPLDLLDYLPGVDELHLIDAARGPVPLGTMQRLDWPVDLPPAFHFGGSHDFDFISALRLAESIGALPSRVTIWIIAAAPASGDPAIGVSPSVAQSIETLLERLRKELVKS